MNALRFLLVLPCISLLYSCTTHAYIKKEQTDKVEYTILEGSEFLILKEFKTEIEHCLGSNKTIGMQLRTIHPGLQDTSRIFIPSDSRFLNDHEEKKMLLYILESKFTPSKAAECLECKTYTRRLN